MVYRPREDSYLIKKELEKRELLGVRCLDMGTGSGVLAMEMAEDSSDVTAVDIDSEALEYAKSRAEELSKEDMIQFKRSDLFEDIDSSNSFDLIVFNPPYLPGKDIHKDELSWHGGKDGIETTKRFLEKVKNYLTEDGETLFILSSRSDMDEIIEEFDPEILRQENTGFETLYLARFG